MIASWMLFALALGALFTVAAFGVERVLTAYGRPVRFAWLAAIVLAVVWPIAPTIARLLAMPAESSVLPFTIVVSSPMVISADEAAGIARALLIDRVLIAVWIGLSVLLFARLVRGAFLLEASRRGWRRGRVNGVRVQVSDNVGPAVVGLRSMDVVVPEWILSLDEPLRAIVLRHEEEHRMARDPYLLFAASLLVALMPWNVALWILARRLRLGVEMDCDARVLRAHPSPERYGMLILTIAQRKGQAPALFAPMLSEPKTNLERRILAMRTTKVARVTAIGGGLVAVSVLALASTLQSAPTSFAQTRTALAQRFVAALPSAFAPAETIPVKAKPPAAPDSMSKQEVRKLPAVTVVTRPGATAIGMSEPGFSADVLKNPMPGYPAELRAAETEGAVIAHFSYDRDGNVDPMSISIPTSTNNLLSSSVQAALRGWHGTPNTTTQVPFVFVLREKTGKDLASYPGGMPSGSIVITGDRVTEAEMRGQAGSVATAQGPQPVNANQTYFEFQVEKPVSMLPDNPSPRYPDVLRTAHVEGDVLAQFVVGTDGKPDMSTFKVLKTNDDLFTTAVINALPNMRFSAAQVGGQAVKQLVQMPFQFNLAKTP